MNLAEIEVLELQIIFPLHFGHFYHRLPHGFHHRYMLHWHTTIQSDADNILSPFSGRLRIICASVACLNGESLVVTRRMKYF